MTDAPTTMTAVVLDAPGPVESLQLRQVPVPTPQQGWVLIAVMAFGLNRSELHTRLGMAQGMTYPRVLGIEATGVVAACPGGEFPVGQQVAAMMGGMGRPRADEVRRLVPGGVDAALDLVGTPTRLDCLHATRIHGTVCSSGMLSNHWTLPDFYRTGDIPSGVRLTGYSGDATDLPADVLQRFLDDVRDGRAVVPIGRIFDLADIQEAHRVMEANTAGGKIVVQTARA